MKSVFGPVPSKRLGQSLGIDPITMKTCNWNCVYCQLGRSTPLCNRRLEYVPTKQILKELENSLNSIPREKIDWITFVGSGEPTLHSEIGELIQGAKAMSDAPIAVLTNGALLYLPEIRSALSFADAVLPTLDAGNAALFRKINRPWPELTFERHIAGLKAFRQEFTGNLWVEVMLIGGLNDGDSELQEIHAILSTIEPDEVHINLPSRPPAETWVQPPGSERLEKARQVLGGAARIVSTISGKIELFSDDDFGEMILGIITRHPLEETLIIQMLSDLPAENVLATLKTLNKKGMAQRIERYGRLFWTSAESKYPELHR